MNFYIISPRNNRYRKCLSTAYETQLSDLLWIVWTEMKENLNEGNKMIILSTEDIK